MADEPNDERPKVVEGVLSGSAALTLTLTATARIRAGFSLPHIQAVRHFADELEAHERAYEGADFGEHWEKSRWYASAAILLGSSAIEAALDETEDDLKIPEPLLIAIQRARFWDRAGAVLAYIGAEQFDKGLDPFRSADLLRALRNGLAHPKAEWFDERTTHKALSTRVISAGLPLSPFIDDPDKAFPFGCMSAGVAQWAAKTAEVFIRDFRTRCGLESYD